MDWEPFLRMLWAAALAAPVGLDRELRGKPAGLRTHVVVAVASGALGYVSIGAADVAGADQTRIAAQVVSGIGFMGAGIIFASGGRVHGLTTAAALWAASAIGLCVGLGADALAIALALVTMAFLWPVDWVVGRALRNVNREDRIVHLVAVDWHALAEAYRVTVTVTGDAHDLSFSPHGEGVAARISVSSRRRAIVRLHEALADVAGLRFFAVEDTAPGDDQPRGRAA